MFVEKIRQHPQFSNASPEDKKLVRPLVMSSIVRATELKTKLLKKYTEEKEENEKVLLQELTH